MRRRKRMSTSFRAKRRRPELASPGCRRLHLPYTTRFLPRLESASGNCRFRKQASRRTLSERFGLLTSQRTSAHAGTLDSKVLRRYRNLLSGVVHDLVRFTFGLHSASMVLANENNLKAARGKHSRKFPFAFADGQSLFGLIPTKWNRGVHALFIVIAILLV